MLTLELKAARKQFGAVEIIKGVDLQVEDKDFVVLVGPSGCGKSTLLRMIAGLEEITSGDLFIDGKRMNDVPPDARGLAMVFQSYALYPHMTVAENMGFALKLAKVPKPERDKKVNAAAKTLQLDQLLERKPGQLSGGQRQRVAIGRAIVRQPRIFLFDEPLSNLDAALRVQMRIELARLHNELKATMVYVTHDQVEAMTLANRIVVMRAGVIEQIGSPLDLYNNPANTFVASFIGSPKMNLLSATVDKVSPASVAVRLAGDSLIQVKGQAKLAVGDKVTVGMRPEAVGISAEGTIPGTVAVIEHLGGETLAYVEMADKTLVTVKLPATSDITLGQQVKLAVASGEPLLFNKDGVSVRHAAGEDQRR
jgi:multiple sugar transport system ATP-binding protein